MTQKQRYYTDIDFSQINFRENPELYKIGKGEQWVLSAEPYKSEILPHWRFKTPEEAQDSAETIYNMFLDYIEEDDFVGSDMSRKFLQMGYTRSMRYANRAGGKKYVGPVPDDKKGLSGAHGRETIPKSAVLDPIKLESAKIFKEYWNLAKNNENYILMKRLFQGK